MSPVQALPSFNLALQPDHYKTVLPNLSYPSRPSTHIPWSGSSAPLIFSKTTRPEPSIPNIQVPTPNICVDTCPVPEACPEAFYGVGSLIWHNFTMVVQKLKLIKQKLFGV